MSCFWDTLIKKIRVEDIQRILSINITHPRDFAEALKKKNCKTNNIVWNTNELSEKEKEENMTHINDYNSSTIQNGYLCSICDPFLLLITEIFCIEIIHHYNNNIIYYKHSEIVNYTITIYSNNNHMW